jgi:hypothetical protein
MNVKHDGLFEKAQAAIDEQGLTPVFVYCVNSLGESVIISEQIDPKLLIRKLEHMLAVYKGKYKPNAN